MAETKPAADESKPAAEGTGETWLNLKFKGVVGKPFTLTLAPTTTVLEVTELVAEKMETVQECVKLIAGRKIMAKKTKSLQDYGVTDGQLIKFSVRFMNYITLESMQGDWWWCAPSCHIDCKVEGGQYSQRDGSQTWEFTVTDEGFGFGPSYIIKPEGIKRDMIKVKTPNSTKKEFWFRRINDEARIEMRKEWGENLNSMYDVDRPIIED